MQACGLSQGARDVITLPDFLCRDLTAVADRLQVVEHTVLVCGRVSLIMCGHQGRLSPNNHGAFPQTHVYPFPLFRHLPHPCKQFFDIFVRNFVQFYVCFQ